MRLKSFAAPALAAIAVSGLFTAPASAEETSRLTICTGGTPTSEPTHCTSVVIPSDELHEVSRRIERCWEEREPEPYSPALSIAAAEECIAAWGPNGTQVPPARHKKKKRPKKRSHKAKIALAPAARP